MHDKRAGLAGHRQPALGRLYARSERDWPHWCNFWKRYVLLGRGCNGTSSRKGGPSLLHLINSFIQNTPPPACFTITKGLCYQYPISLHKLLPTFTCFLLGGFPVRLDRRLPREQVVVHALKSAGRPCCRLFELRLLRLLRRFADGVRFLTNGVTGYDRLLRFAHISRLSSRLSMAVVGARYYKRIM